jgi:hypothetical protein
MNATVRHLSSASQITVFPSVNAWFLVTPPLLTYG